MKTSKKTTTAQDWLDMDLKAQSGAITVSKKKNYKTPKPSALVLKPDPVRYGGKDNIESSQIIE